MRITWTIGSYRMEVSNRARRSVLSAVKHTTECGVHLVWWRFSVLIENVALEVWPICATCGSADIGEVSYCDEGVTVCQNCGGIEQGYAYVSLLDYEAAS